MSLTEREVDMATRAIQKWHAGITERDPFSHAMQRRRYRAGDSENRRKEQVKVAYLVARVRRHMEATVAKRDNVRTDTQRRQQDAIRVLAEAACDLRQRLDLEERRPSGDLSACRAGPGMEVRAEGREGIEAADSGPTELYTYALKLFMLVVCLIYWWWQRPVPTLVH